MRKIFIFLILSTFLLISNANALQIAAQLTGDIRDDNPDYLLIDVTIDIIGNIAKWTVDLNMISHPDVKLDVFYFNITEPTDIYSFSGFSPSDWEVIAGDNLQGAGGGTFIFETNDPPQNTNNVTNTTSLYFTMTKTSGGDFTGNEFLYAPFTSLNDGLEAAQLGAHLQSLEKVGDPTPGTDSGFAVGNYFVPDEPPPQETAVPEPATMLLLGTGLISIAGTCRKKRNS